MTIFVLCLINELINDVDMPRGLYHEESNQKLLVHYEKMSEVEIKLRYWRRNW